MRTRAPWFLFLLLLASCSSGPTVLRIGLYAGNPWGVPSGDSYRFMDSAIADYQALHPDVRVVYRPGTLREDYSEWLAQGLVQGIEPDLFAVLTGDFTTFASIGAMEDLDPWIDGSTDFSRGDFYSTALRSGQFRGAQLAMPLEVAPNLMFVNTTLLHSAGIAEPQAGWTWDDFYRICEAVTRDLDGDGQIDQFGTNRPSWRSFSITNGADPWDPSGLATSFGSAAFAQTVTFISRVQKLARHQDIPSFDSGKVAFSSDLWSSFRAYSSYPYRVNRFSQFQWVALPMPRGPNGKGASELQSSLIAVSHHSAHKGEAWDFLKFLVSLKTQENLVRYSYGWPVLKAASRTGLLEAMLEKGAQGNVGVAIPQVIDSIIEESVVTPRFHKWDEVMAIADRELYRLIDDPYNLQGRLLALDQSLREVP